MAGDCGRCPDGGTCHHNCGVGYCFRVEYCEPLTIAGWGDRWPSSIRRDYGTPTPNSQGEGGEMNLSSSRPRMVELTGRSGIKLQVQFADAAHRYRVTLGDSDEKWSEDFRDLHDLVEFIGYPQESTDRADKAEAAFKEAQEQLEAERERANRLDTELLGIEGVVRELVDNLADAWWLRAADAYKSLSSWLVRR